MSQVGLLYLTLVVVSAASGLVGLMSWRWRAKLWLRRLSALGGWSCTALALSTWGLRWYQAGHLPLLGTYESALALCVVILCAALILEQLSHSEAGVLPVACLLTSAAALHGMGFDAAAHSLPIYARSWAVQLHAVVAWSAFGVLALNAGLALRCVVLDATERQSRWLARSLHWGFVLHSAMMVSGALSQLLLRGRAWSFDPVESLGMVAWLSYGALMHLHLRGGWSGRRLAWWCLLLFLVLVVSYRGIVSLPPGSTYHVFEPELNLGETPAPP